MRYLILVIVFSTLGCSNTTLLQREVRNNFKRIPQNNFPLHLDSLVKQLDTLNTRDRESVIIPLMLQGGVPGFNFNFRKVQWKAKGADGRNYKATIFVSPDYACFGNNHDYMRIPLSPQAGQILADSFHCVLPTTKMVDAIYDNATLKLEPIPLTDKREAFSTFLDHDRLIKQQLNNKEPIGLTAGTKKDVVQTMRLMTTLKQHRVAIYGWHQLNGKPIQPLYLGHVDWYVDYSHGTRLLYEKMILNGKVVKIKDVLDDEKLRFVLCNEEYCGYTRYPVAE